MICRGPIVLTAGGTGGHLFPARALASSLLKRGHAVAVVTDRRGQRYAEVFHDVDLHSVPAAGFAGGPLAKIRAAAAITSGAIAARGLLRRLRPAAVVGFGGYPSLPCMLAATWGRWPSLLHEQNAVIGRTNRFLAPRVGAIALSYPSTSGLASGLIGRACVTGNPVRDAFAAVREVPYVAPADGPIRLLVTGGSQGAAVLDAVVPNALSALPEAVRQRLRVTQQCREDDIEQVRAVYRDAGITADLATFIDDVPGLLASAHLAVTRAGASTIAELTVAGRPAIVVPYPHHADGQQLANAQALVAAGGGWMVEQERFTNESCRRALLSLVEEPSTLSEMAAAAGKLGRVQAAADLADLVERVACHDPVANRPVDDDRRAAA